MRHIKRHIKFALVLLQIGLLSSAFFFLFGVSSAILFVLNEISLADILDFLLIMSSMEGFSFIVFLEGLFWVVFKKNKKQVEK